MANAGVPPNRRTPDHPPYALMIGAAIRHLSEHGGSTPAAISDYIRAHYDGLPWAHDKLLPYYLEKLTAQGEFTIGAAPGRYVAVPNAAARRPPCRRKRRSRADATKTGEEGGGGGSSSALPLMTPPLAALRPCSSSRKRTFVQELVYVLALPCQKSPTRLAPAST